MNEQKTPKKPLIFYVVLCFLALMIFNALFVPMMQNMRIKEVSYNTFVQMLNDGEISQVEYEDSQIVFAPSDKEDPYI